jgi:NADH:ubiquinone oxidoreductase subunit F (NADH-binding)
MIMTEERRVRRDAIIPDEALALVRDVALTGHGGGSFPTAIKLAAARERRAEVIVNACDGEPLVHKDTVLLRNRPMLVADGIAIVQRIVRPRRTWIAVHAGSPAETAAYDVVDRGQLRAEVLAVPDRYVSSEASSLTSLAHGGEARPIFRDVPLTTAVPGRRRRPTLVLNAETVARLAVAWLDGASRPTRLITMAGDVARPGVLEAPLSMTVDDLVLGAGPSAPPRALLIGGYGGRWIDWADARGQTLFDLGDSLGAGLIMVDADGCPLRTVGTILGYLADQSAGQCGPCMFGLPAIAADWQQLGNPYQAAEAERRLRRRLPTIADRGACHHPDGAVGMAASALSVFSADLAAHRHGHCIQTRVLSRQS